MSRRKQARPSRHLELDEDGNGIPVLAKKDDKCEEEGRGAGWKCGVRGKEQEGDSAPSRSRSSRHPLSSSPNDDDEMDDGTAAGHAETIPQSNCLTDEEDDELHTEDANNNESKARDVSVERDMESKETHKESLATALHSLIGGNFPWPAGLVGPNVTLEAIQNTKVAMAQYTANALNVGKKSGKISSNGTSGDGSEGSFQELAALQSTLFTLQQQQLLQLQLLQHLQQQLVSKSSQNSIQQDDSSPPNSPSPVPSTSTTPQPPEMNNSNAASNVINSSATTSSSKPSSVQHVSMKQHTAKPNTTSSSNNNNSISNSNSSPSNNNGSGSSSNNNNSASSNGIEGLNPHFASLLNCANQDPNQPLSPGLPSASSATSILSPNGDLNIIREPNTLEMLQKRTQEVLDSASQGLLASSLVDDPNYRKKGIGMEKGREPFFKHRCRYCGKVFSSDSALQIHIRSHTGERPFKCNVCGSRFTTKGNLKVHFQRHTARFPHVRMNPHPVPEHLDHLHPPMRGSGGSNNNNNNGSGHSTPNHSPTGSNPFRTPPPPQAAFHPFNPLFHFGAAAAAAAAAAAQQQQAQPMKIMPMAVPVLKENLIGPEDLTKPKGSSNNNNNNNSSGKNEDDLKTNVEIKEEVKEEAIDDDDMMDDDDGSMIHDGKDDEDESKKSNSLDLRDDDDDRKKEETDDCSMDSMENDHMMDMSMEESSQDQPENLSSKSLPLMYPLPLMVRPGRPSSSSTLTFARISPAPQFPPGSSMGKGLGPLPVDIDPAKDPAIYTNLLPRPGSNDNAWESLIEVTKTSETAKLQQLVDNIDHKVTDPNQCIICQRVLSCKSALQMHYRTHTGERPFKCKICGRTFTTKGNLKTHMGVHRAKPPLRALLQCPVCHKRFTNSLVLQQHIRLHTGEPTDLTPEQIRAAEVKDFGFLASNPHFPPFPPHGSPPLFLNHALLKQHGAVPHSIPPQNLHSPEGSPSSPGLNNAYNSSSGDEASTPQQSKGDAGGQENFPVSSLAALENQVKTVNTMAGSSNNGVKTKFSKGSPNGSAHSPAGGAESPENDSDNPLALNNTTSSSVPSSPASSSQNPQQQQQQQPFITSTIIPHNNLQFLKVNYVFVK